MYVWRTYCNIVVRTSQTTSADNQEASYCWWDIMPDNNEWTC